jgi:hypothetical protein
MICSFHIFVVILLISNPRRTEDLRHCVHTAHRAVATITQSVIHHSAFQLIRRYAALAPEDAHERKNVSPNASQRRCYKHDFCNGAL